MEVGAAGGGGGRVICLPAVASVPALAQSPFGRLALIAQRRCAAVRKRTTRPHIPRSIRATRVPTLRMTKMPTLAFATPPPSVKSSNIHLGVMGA